MMGFMATTKKSPKKRTASARTKKPTKVTKAVRTTKKSVATKAVKATPAQARAAFARQLRTLNFFSGLVALALAAAAGFLIDRKSVV